MTVFTVLQTATDCWVIIAVVDSEYLSHTHVNKPVELRIPTRYCPGHEVLAAVYKQFSNSTGQWRCSRKVHGEVANTSVRYTGTTPMCMQFLWLCSTICCACRIRRKMPTHLHTKSLLLISNPSIHTVRGKHETLAYSNKNSILMGAIGGFPDIMLYTYTSSQCGYTKTRAHEEP